MNEASKKLKEPNLPLTDKHIFLPGLEGGLLPFDSQDGPKTEKSGPGAAPASRSPRPAKAAAPPTSDTSGPSFSGSSLSAALASSLASRSRAKLGSAGSMEYSQTWKEKATPAGRSLWAHTASAHRTSDRESIGWPIEGWPKTPQASDGQGGVMEIRPGTTGKYKLRDFAQLAGFPTPNVPNGGRQPAGGMSPTGKTLDGKKRQVGTEQIAMIAGWTTALSTDHQRGRMTDEAMERERPGAGSGLSLDARLAGWPPTTTRDCKTDGKDAPNRTGAPSLPGLITELFLVPTGRRVVLAPEFSLWLMGFPEAWVTAAPGAKDWLEAQAALELECSRAAETPSSPNSPPNS